MVVCRIFFGLWLLKYWRVCIVYRQWRSNFLGKENQNKKSRTGSYVFSGFGNGISRGWERKSTTNRFATGRFWLCTWKIFIFIYIFLSVGTNLVTKNFVYWKLGPLFVFVVIPYLRAPIYCSLCTSRRVLVISSDVLFLFRHLKRIDSLNVKIKPSMGGGDKFCFVDVFLCSARVNDVFRLNFGKKSNKTIIQSKLG